MDSRPLLPRPKDCAPPPPDLYPAASPHHWDSCSYQVGAGISPAWHGDRGLGWALRGEEPSQGQPLGRPEALPGPGRGEREKGNSQSPLAGWGPVISLLPPRQPSAKSLGILRPFGDTDPEKVSSWLEGAQPSEHRPGQPGWTRCGQALLPLWAWIPHVCEMGTLRWDAAQGNAELMARRGEALLIHVDVSHEGGGLPGRASSTHRLSPLLLPPVHLSPSFCPASVPLPSCPFLLLAFGSLCPSVSQSLSLSLHLFF